MRVDTRNETVELTRFARLNFPHGFEPNVINKFFKENEKNTRPKSRSYSTLLRAVEAGLIERVYKGFYRAKKVTNNRRYYLHRRLKRNSNYKVKARSREIEIKYGTESTQADSRYLNELVSIGYNLQSTIF